MGWSRRVFVFGGGDGGKSGGVEVLDCGSSSDEMTGRFNMLGSSDRLVDGLLALGVSSTPRLGSVRP